MTEKATGWILIFFGIIIMAYAAVSVYMVFTKLSKPVKLFTFSGISLNPAQLIPGLPAGISASQTPMELIPADMVNTTSNLMAHIFLMGFLASIGYKVASLGTKLVRPIVVKLQSKDETLPKETNTT